MSCCKGHSCTKTIETPTSGNIVKFPDVAEIRDGKIKSITMRRMGSLTGYSSTGATLAADTVIAGAHMQLVNANNRIVMQIPLMQLQRDYNAPEPYQCDPNVFAGIDLSRTQIIINTSAAGYSATAVIEMTFEYNCEDC